MRALLIELLRQVPRRAGRGLILIYRYALSPLVGFDCRHLPTCSVYADEALDRFGLWAGGWMTLARLCRCHPWGSSGLDVVPDTLRDGACWYIPWRYGRWRRGGPPSTPAQGTAVIARAQSRGTLTGGSPGLSLPPRCRSHR